MRVIAVVLLLFAALSAHAQVYKCRDSNGRVFYTDKPVRGCQSPDAEPAKPAAKGEAKKGAAKPAAKSAAASRAAKAKPKPKPTPDELAQRASTCRTLREQLEWLNSPRAAELPNRDARIGQVKNALRECS
jgi:hypothetical protein